MLETRKRFHDEMAALESLILRMGEEAGRAVASHPKPPLAFRPSFAQSGEDVIVSFIFGHLNLPQPSYIDIGEKLGMPVASIGPTRARCLDKLRKLLS